MYFHYLVSAILLLVALSVSNAEKDMERICADDAKEAVIGCFYKWPEEHYEIIKACDSNLQDIGEDRGKIFEHMCETDPDHGFEVAECILDTYGDDNQKFEENAAAFEECMKVVEGD